MNTETKTIELGVETGQSSPPESNEGNYHPLGAVLAGYVPVVRRTGPGGELIEDDLETLASSVPANAW